MVVITELAPSEQSSVSSWDGQSWEPEENPTPTLFDEDLDPRGLMGETQLPLAAEGEMRPEKADGERFVRTYMKEGRVALASGLTSQDRYLFLFSDLLLVAKEKGENSYKLKEKVRLCELWLRGEATPGLVEQSPDPATSFVIGWPTNSFLAQFRTSEERSSWFRLLKENVDAERDREILKVAKAPVHFKAPRAHDEVRLLPIHNCQTAEDLLRLAICEFDLEGDPAEAYQLWFRSPKESSPYPLFGLESPFAILLNAVKDALPEAGSEAELTELRAQGLNPVTLGVKAHFALRPRASHAHLVNLKAEAPKASRRSIVSKIRRKLGRKDSPSRAPPDDAAPLGTLFGRRLEDTAAEPAHLPPPIEELLRWLWAHGRRTEGIFRKPPKQRTVKELRDALDRGAAVDWDAHFPIVNASVLKDFLRSVPGKLLLPATYFEWVSLTDPAPHSLKIAKAERLLSALGRERLSLLRHLLCLVEGIKAKAALNSMDAQSLAVCLGPSLIDRPVHAQTQHSFKLLPLIARFLIDNIAELFGEETLSLLGPEDDGSSIEAEDFFDEASSLAAEGSRERSSLRKHQQSHTSRDSGLSEDCPEDLPKPPLTTRSVSESLTQAMALCDRADEDEGPEAQSMEDLTAPPRRESQSSSQPSSVDEFGAGSSLTSSEAPEARNPRLRFLKKTPYVGTLERSASGEHLVLREKLSLATPHTRLGPTDSLSSEGSPPPPKEAKSPLLQRQLSVSVGGASPEPSGTSEPPSSSGISSSSHDSLSGSEPEATAPRPLFTSLRSRSGSDGPHPPHRQLSAVQVKIFARKLSSASSATADSSTVTETDSEEDGDPTPVVSRESSKADELEAKVRAMFPPATRVKANPAILKRRSLPSYEEAVARHVLPEPGSRTPEPGIVRDRIRRYDRENLRRKTLGGSEEMEAIRAQAVNRHREGRRGSAGVCALIQAESAAKRSPESTAARPILRAKSLGRTPVSPAPTTSASVWSPPAEPTGMPPVVSSVQLPRGPPVTVPQEPCATSEINWSVNNLKQRFASELRREAPELVTPSSRLPYEQRKPVSFDSVPSWKSAALGPLEDGGRSSSTYAVLRPPPLASVAPAPRLHSTSMLQSTAKLQSLTNLQPASKLHAAPKFHSAPKLQTVPRLHSVATIQSATAQLQSSGPNRSKVRALASNFESGKLPPPGEESYV